MAIAFSPMLRKRAGWLTALFLGEMLTATAMGAFEHEISRAVVLALFVPLIISSGGNSGSQASTLVIRALALGEVGLRDWWRVMRREVAGRPGARRDPRQHRLRPHHALVGVLRIYGAALAARGAHGRPSRSSASCSGARSSDRCCRSCCAAGLRPRHVVCAVRRDARGRHRPHHLLLRGARAAAGHTALVSEAP